MEDAAVLPHLAALQKSVLALHSPVSPRKSCPLGYTLLHDIRVVALFRVLRLPCKRAKDGWELLRQDVLHLLCQCGGCALDKVRRACAAM